jgi:hypothetical protein
MPYHMSLICPGTFQVTVYGGFLPRHIFYHFHALCAYLRCIFVALCVLFVWPTFDVVLADQVSVVIPLLKLKKSMKVSIPLSYNCYLDVLVSQLFHALHLLPGCILLSFSRSVTGSTHYSSEEDI